MSEPATHDDTIAFDMPCTGCGYNLRTGKLAGLCPECGQPKVTSIEVYVRRSGMNKQDLRDLASRSPEFLRSVWLGSLWGFAANAVAVAIACLPGSAFAPHGQWRIVALCLVCYTFACSALAFWRHGGAMQPWFRRIVRAGAVAIVMIPFAYGLSDPVILRPLRDAVPMEQVGELLMLIYCASAGVVALAFAVRVFHQSWWLRLERRWWLGWPLLPAAVYPFVVYFGCPMGFGLERRSGGRWTEDLYTFDVVRGFPAATGESPTMLRSIVEELGHYWTGRQEQFFVGAFLALQLWFLFADVTLASRARKALRRLEVPAEAVAPAGTR